MRIMNSRKGIKSTNKAIKIPVSVLFTMELPEVKTLSDIRAFLPWFDVPINAKEIVWKNPMVMH